MKKIFFTTVAMLLITINCFSQAATKTNYLQKSKNQKTAAFVLLSVGAALDIGGIIVTISNANKEVDYIFSTQTSSVNHGAEYALYAAGTACLLGSLTLFIVSKSNKQKGMALGLDTQQFRKLNKNKLYTANYPALTLKIAL